MEKGFLMNKSASKGSKIDGKSGGSGVGVGNPSTSLADQAKLKNIGSSGMNMGSTTFSSSNLAEKKGVQSAVKLSQSGDNVVAHEDVGTSVGGGLFTSMAVTMDGMYMTMTGKPMDAPCNPL
ncbi:hypothetical protein CTI12_AA610710 [Artemisia annua]|uniref:Uncharacterized protein n=1 Tax=Artemisia annua TaxID=35608 RepID=A0A2U1KEU8_ARTAN|nr:hypothetical protein CTI12_AA610710 [Artemisia annua]